MRDFTLVELKALREALEAWPAARVVAPELQSKIELELLNRGWVYQVRAFENSWKQIDKK